MPELSSSEEEIQGLLTIPGHLDQIGRVKLAQWLEDQLYVEGIVLD